MAKKNDPSDVWNNIQTFNHDPNVCWPWQGQTGGRDERGYMSVDGKRLLVYRIVFELTHRPLQSGEVVRHICDNPICCNPTHLEAGTRSDNELDKSRRDRWGFTDDMIKDIRRFNKMGMTYVANADAINAKHKTQITASGVGKVIRGERKSEAKTDDGEQD